MRLSKKHFLTAFITALFILPLAIFPKQAGQVLGINEVRGNNGETISQINNGDIASGARDVVSQSSTIEFKPIFGKALWDSKQKVKVSTNKFNSGSSIEVSYNGKKVVFLVEGQRNDLTEETVLILNTEAFLEIGGNLESQGSINIEAIQLN